MQQAKIWVTGIKSRSYQSLDRINALANLIRQSGPTAACLHFVLLCGRDLSEAAALAASGGRRHPRKHFHWEHGKLGHFAYGSQHLIFALIHLLHDVSKVRTRTFWVRSSTRQRSTTTLSERENACCDRATTASSAWRGAVLRPKYHPLSPDWTPDTGARNYPFRAKIARRIHQI
ncbi:hypothetical protein TcasGA2_TC011258 [Tribolium castaneum]|uniref:Uncharacterized protein n=1 Tax=Tribolium castaneum TaxID=7070 RepID=D6X3I8_TRICA|nr:hypothetical protein TcasGA2_TC011258 [Tribolium castaneum]